MNHLSSLPSTEKVHNLPQPCHQSTPPTQKIPIPPTLFPFKHENKSKKFTDWAHMVFPRLFLGSVEAAQLVQTQHKKYKIDVIVTIGSFKLSFPDCIHIVVALDDHPHENIIQYFSLINGFLNHFYLSSPESNILVHCRQGASRSASFLIAFLSQLQNRSVAQVFSAIHKIRKVVRPNPGFREQLVLWERMGRKINPQRDEYQIFVKKYHNDEWTMPRKGDIF